MTDIVPETPNTFGLSLVARFGIANEAEAASPPNNIDNNCCTDYVKPHNAHLF